MLLRLAVLVLLPSLDISKHEQVSKSNNFNAWLSMHALSLAMGYGIMTASGVWYDSAKTSHKQRKQQAEHEAGVKCESGHGTEERTKYLRR
jgi:hypothetical protein